MNLSLVIRISTTANYVIYTQKSQPKDSRANSENMSNGENKSKSRSQNQGQGAADGSASGSQAAPTAIGSTERNRPSTAASQGMLAAGSTEQSMYILDTGRLGQILAHWPNALY